MISHDPAWPRIAVLVACYNRWRVTLPNLGEILDALKAAHTSFQVFLLDDASPDGTGRRVREAYPEVKVIDGDGHLYWNRGMHRLHKVAREEKAWDAYLLFNDDVTVDASAVSQFLALWRVLNSEEPTTLVGATTALTGKRITYSGMRQTSPRRPLRLSAVEPSERPLPIDSFNGNFVLIPANAFDGVGGLDEYYKHSFGDVDLGLSLRAKGHRILLAPGTIGRCDDRPPAVPSRHGLMERMRRGLTGLEDPRQHMHLVWKHAPTRVSAAVAIAGMLAKRLLVLAANRPHVCQHSPDASLPRRIDPVKSWRIWRSRANAEK
jgi:GT2 family glycosyltransferase